MADNAQAAHTRPPDDALQTSLLVACDAEAAAASSRWSLLRRALDQGLQVCHTGQLHLPASHSICWFRPACCTQAASCKASALYHCHEPGDGMQVPGDMALADALCVLIAWAGALPSPLLSAQAARGAESCTSLPGAEALLADSCSPASCAIFRQLLGELLSTSVHACTVRPQLPATRLEQAACTRFCWSATATVSYRGFQSGCERGRVSRPAGGSSRRCLLWAGARWCPGNQPPHEPTGAPAASCALALALPDWLVAWRCHQPCKSWPCICTTSLT